MPAFGGKADIALTLTLEAKKVAAPRSFLPFLRCRLAAREAGPNFLLLGLSFGWWRSYGDLNFCHRFGSANLAPESGHWMLRNGGTSVSDRKGWDRERHKRAGYVRIPSDPRLAP
jgi:hypothetical protein